MNRISGIVASFFDLVCRKNLLKVPSIFLLFGVISFPDLLLAEPVCSNAYASPNLIVSNNHKRKGVSIRGITDNESGPLTLEVQCILQDEPVNGRMDGNTKVDGFGIGRSKAWVRAESQGGNDGRVYHIGFVAKNNLGESCADTITVGVKRTQSGQLVDGGPIYDSSPKNRKCVTLDNTAPTITSIPPAEAVVETTYQHQILVQDDYTSHPLFTLKNGPEGMIVTTDGLIIWTPRDASPELASVIVDIDDRNGLHTLLSFDINVEDSAECGAETWAVKNTEIKRFNFSENWTLYGNAVVLNPKASNGRLRLTDRYNQASSAIYKPKIRLTDGNGKPSDLNIYFKVKLYDAKGVTDNDGVGGDGVTMMLSADNSPQGAGGGSLGYDAYKRSIALELDTWKNQWDRNGNHIGINTRGELSSIVQKKLARRINNGKVRHVWFDYSAKDKTIEIRIASNKQKPRRAKILKKVDIQEVLGVDAFHIGFTGSTSSASQKQDIRYLSVTGNQMLKQDCATEVLRFVTGAAGEGISGQKYRHTVIAESDTQDSQITYSLIDGPEGVTLSQSGLLEYTASEPGLYPIKILAMGSFGGQVEQLFRLEVFPAENSKPIADADSFVVEAGQSIAVQLTGSDPDNDAITFEIIEGAGNGVLTGSVPNLEYTPNTGFVGLDQFIFQVSDGYLLSNKAVVMIDVQAPTDVIPPVITLLGNNPQMEAIGSSYSETGATAFDEVDGIVEVRVVSNNINASVPGEYAVVYRAADSAGNINEVTRTVIYLPAPDLVGPVVTITGANPAEVTVRDVYSDAGAVAVDAVDGSVSVEVISNTVNVNSSGTYKVVYSAADTAGNLTTAIRIVVVTDAPDTVSPEITIIGANPIEITIGDGYADAGATAVDAVDGSVMVTIESNTVDFNRSGTYEVVYKATDAAGNSSTATRVVIVTDAPDTVGPVITITGANPAEITVGDEYTDAGATAIDAVDGSVKVTVESNTVDANTSGSYEVVYKATDAAGNSSTATRVVIVADAPDTVGPVITITGANPAELIVGEEYIDAGATAIDAVDGSVKVTVESKTVDVDAIGSYEVVYTATDAAGNSSTATRIVIVTDAPDTVGPVITITGANPAEITVGDEYTDAGATAIDAVDGSVKVTVESNTVDDNTSGRYEVVYAATDAAGNSSTATRVVIVTDAPDTVGPVITITGANPAELTIGEGYIDAGAAAIDAVDGSVKVTVESNTVDDNTSGRYEVVYTATDAAGNSSTATRIVIVTDAPDTVGPVITITGANPSELKLGDVYTDKGATAVDAVDGSVAITVESNTVDIGIRGTYEVVYSAIDVAGNSSTATRVVIVTDAPDTVAPVITIIGANPVEIIVGDVYTDAGATADDAVDGPVIVTISSNTVDTSTGDSYEVVYKATDVAGNSSTATRVVIVTASSDTVGPIITIAGDNPSQIVVGDQYTDAGATAVDAVDGVVLVSIVSNTVDANTSGSYQVVYSATDLSANTTTATRTVLVKSIFGDAAPEISMLGAYIIEVNLGSPYQDFGATAYDDEDGRIEVQVTDTVNTAEAGTYTITYAATDSVGNVSTLTRVVEVKEFVLDRTLSSSIPKTGASVSYGVGDDAIVQAGAPRVYEHDLVADIVYDQTYKLSWQDSPDNTIEATWGEADAACDNLDVGGFTDWRLPSAIELSFLVDFGQFAYTTGRSNAIDSAFQYHETARNPYFWTAHQVPNGLYRTVSFLLGSWSQSASNSTTKEYYRCVRGEKPSFKMRPNRDPADVSYDTQNRLMWQDDATVIDVKRPWAEALQYCGDLTLNNADDWRLPNRNEMLTLFDYIISTNKRALDTTLGRPTDWWTSTISPDGSGTTRRAVTMYAQRGTGNITSGYLTNSKNVRCVRDFLEPVTLTQGDLVTYPGAIEFDASNSFSLDGTIVSYQWFEDTFLSTDRLIAEGIKPTAEFLNAGTFDIYLLVTNSHGVQSRADFSLTIVNNQRPIAIITGDSAISPAEPIEFTARFSRDYDGEIVAYEWSIDDDIVGTKKNLFTTDKPAPGYYYLHLKVTDDGGASTTKRISLGILPPQDDQFPIAKAGADQTVSLGSPVTFNAAGSTDPDGEVVQYRWRQDSRVLSRESSFAHSDFSLGSNLIELEVRDNAGSTDVDYMILTVVEATTNVAPQVEDLTVSLEEDGSAILILSATDANPGSSLLLSIVDTPANGVVSIVDDEFVYTPNPDFAGSDQLTFKANDGELDSNIGVVSITVTEVNDVPVANAGLNHYATQGDTVTLDGSDSRDDGAIVQYRWTLNGQLLSSEMIANVSDIPIGGNVVKLEVTDDIGEIASDTTYVRISEPTQPGFIVSGVSGNTVSVGSRAEFRIELKTQPGSDVTVAISSSDPLEGVPLTDSVIFSPVDWNVPKVVTIRGTNPAVFEGQQDYTIILGVAQSSDSNYDGINPEDVAIHGLGLSFLDNGNPRYFVSGINQYFIPEITANGSDSTSHSITASPPGVAVSEASAAISWNPPLSAESRIHTVEISSEMQGLIFDNTVDIRVLSSKGVQGSSNDSSFTVTDSSSSLTDIIFSYRGEVPSNLGLREITDTNMPLLADGAELLTSGFYTQADVPVDLQIPLDILSDLTQMPRIELYSWSADAQYWSRSSLDLKVVEKNGQLYANLKLVSTSGLAAIALVPVPDEDLIQIDRSVSTNTGRSKGFVTLESNFQSRNKPVALLNITKEDVNCRPTVFDLIVFEIETHIKQTCTVAGVYGSDGVNLLEFVVKGFGYLHPNFGKKLLWKDGTSVEELMVWVGQTRYVFDELNLSNKDRAITISIDLLPTDLAGQVRANLTERANILHLTSADVPSELMQIVTVHEYVHHAQNKTNLETGGRPLISNSEPEVDIQAIWMIESTANWFEDYVYDSINYYRKNPQLPNPLFPVLEDGIYSEKNNSIFGSGDSGDGNPYVLGLFFKMLSSHCKDFEIQLNSLFYGNYLSSDPNRIKALEEFLSRSQCNFGPQLGSTESDKLSAAFMFYQYATLYAGPAGKISLLDSNETDAPDLDSDIGFAFKQPPIKQSSTHLAAVDDEPQFKLNSTHLTKLGDEFKYETDYTLPPYSAVSLEIGSLWDNSAALGEDLNEEDQINFPSNNALRDLEAVVKITTSNDSAAKVGIIGENDLFAGNSTLGTKKHYYYETNNVCDGEYVFNTGAEKKPDESGASATGFITIVNTTIELIDNVEVELILRDIVYYQDPLKNTSQNRAKKLEFEDLPEAATRQMTWDDAFSFCDNLTLNEETNWRLPNAPELMKTYYQNRTGTGSFAYPSFEDYYWTSNGNASGTAYSTVRGDGHSTELSSSGGISKGLSRNVRCVRDTSNICEIN